MMNAQNTDSRQAARSSAAAHAWWLVCKQELSELWLGGRMLNLLILYSVLLSITTYLLATNNELTLAPVPITELIALQGTITFGLLISLIIAAESISGERERATLETLLLIPAGRRQLVTGKFLAALSAWPAALLLSVPYMVALGQGDPIVGPALLWGALLGTVLAATFTALGMVVSIWSTSNKVSLFVSLLIYVLCLLPSQLPGQVQATPTLIAIRALDPVEATNQILQKLVTNSQPQITAGTGGISESELALYFAGLVVVSAVVIGFLFLFVAPRLHLDGGRASIIPSLTKRTEVIE
jgi:ABC-type transport system involved in multi-copper enzyme maturation permease subunit